MDKNVRKVKFKTKINKYSLFRYLQNIDRRADSKVPKALACVFDGLIGAILFDSNYSLKAVWDVIFPLFRK